MRGEWEYRKACRWGTGVDPGLWAIDASLEQHVKALVICHACPVKRQCFEQAEEKFAGKRCEAGLYAGRVWGDKSGPKTVWAWHRRARSGGEHLNQGSIETRVCAGLDCTEEFTVGGGERRSRKYHAQKCADAANRKARRERDAVRARQEAG
jgi:hypothetical protein